MASTPPTLTVFFVIDAQRNQHEMCYVAASVRDSFPDDVKIVAYCRRDKLATLDDAVVETMRRLRCDLVSFDVDEVEANFDRNFDNLVAARHARDTDFSVFVSPKILFTRPVETKTFTRPGVVVAPTKSILTSQVSDIRKMAFQTAGSAAKVDFSAIYPGLNIVSFSEGSIMPDGKSFSQVWASIGSVMRLRPELDHLQDDVDRVALSIAIELTGLKLGDLPASHQIDLGKIKQPDQLPDRDELKAVIYDSWDQMRTFGLAEHGYRCLKRNVGVRRTNQIWDEPDPNDPEGSPVPTREGLKDYFTIPAPTDGVAPIRTDAPDPQKKNIAALTMVYRDHFFLERWVRYYSDQIGRENLYILRHGEDPEIDRIAEGCNITHIPNPENKWGFDNRRWLALSQMTSALTQCYNWVLCNDVDEIVAVDPDVAPSLSDYLNSKFADGNAPGILSPFAIEIVHIPNMEPEPIEDDSKILSIRRSFRLNTNYSKPCITRQEVSFSGGGHGCNVFRVPLDPHLYLFHLRYVDDKISQERLEERKAWIVKRKGKYEPGKRTKNSWDDGAEAYLELRKNPPFATTVDFDEVRKAMTETLDHYGNGKWLYRNLRSKDNYRLPQRFRNLF